MSWTTPADLTAQLARLWERGELLQTLLTGDAGFPLRLALKGPSSAEISDRFDAVRTWTAELAAASHLRIEWREVRHRVQGSQRLPEQVWVETLDDALALLGKRREAARLSQLLDLTQARMPAVLPWLARRPLRAIELADHWSRLLAVVQWLIDHPRPGMYLRQVDVPEVHSKFIEAHRAVLSELFDLALPAHAIRGDLTGISGFAGRYGFLDRPTRIRFRILDQDIQLLPGTQCPDIALDADSFAGLQMPVNRVIITENETNFLAFPAARETVVIFGAGYGWASLAKARWLLRCAIHYWGDIDTHGFAILNQLRGHFGHVSSFLMDRETLLAHQTQWGEEPDQALVELPCLNVAESALYDELRHNRIRANLRLEQERIGFHWLKASLAQITRVV